MAYIGIIAITGGMDIERPNPDRRPVPEHIANLGWDDPLVSRLVQEYMCAPTVDYVAMIEALVVALSRERARVMNQYVDLALRTTDSDKNEPASG